MTYLCMGKQPESAPFGENEIRHLCASAGVTHYPTRALRATLTSGS